MKSAKIYIRTQSDHSKKGRHIRVEGIRGIERKNPTGVLSWVAQTEEEKDLLISHMRLVLLKEGYRIKKIVDLRYVGEKQLKLTEQENAI